MEVLKACHKPPEGINSTTEAISFLDIYVISPFIGYLNGYYLDNIYITRVKEKREPDLKLAFLYV